MSLLMKVVCLMLLAAGAVFGQAARGTITGTVSDPVDAMIPGATVEAKHMETGTVLQVVSTSTGNYTVANLDPGGYQLTVTAPGFKKFVQSGISVLSAQVSRIDIKLEMGEVTELVSVTADAPLLKTESSDIAHTVEGKKLSDLPVVGFSMWIRSPLNVAQLMPGTLVGEQAFFRVQGAPNFSQSVRIEGQDVTNTVQPLAPVQNQASVEAVAEYTVQTSNYAAEYGQAGGGIVNLTIRSGSNDYHGSVYNYWTNEALSSRLTWLHFRNRNRKNNWGFTISGPFTIPKLYDARDKTFFFFSLEQNRHTNKVENIYNAVPTPAMRMGDFRESLTGRVSGVRDPLGRTIHEGAIYNPLTHRLAPDGRAVRDPFMGCDGKTLNVICLDPGSPHYYTPGLDPIAVKIQNFIPLPNISGRIIENYLTGYENVNRMTIPTLRLDHSLSTRSKLSFMYSSTEEVGLHPPITADGMPEPITTRNDTNTNFQTYRISFQHSLSPTLLLHLAGGYQGNWWPLIPKSYDAAKELGLKSYAGYFPQITGLYSATTGGYSRNMGASVISFGHLYKPTANASLTWVKANHSYKFGAEMRIDAHAGRVSSSARGIYAFSAQDTALPIPGFPGGGIVIGNPYASFLLGGVNSGNIGHPTQMRWGKNAWGLFAQDTWKVTRKLTIDYGLRWDYQTYLREQYGRLPSFSPTALNPSTGNLPGAVVFEGGPNPVKFAKVYPHAWGPRFGIAYQFMPETVLRGGIGIVYGQTSADRQQIEIMSSANPYQWTSFGDPVVLLKNGPPTPAPWPNFDPGQYPAPGLTVATPFAVDHNAGRPPRQIQWSIGIQREITRNLSVEASYVGNRGAWWEGNLLLNMNGLTAEGLAAKGLDVNKAADVDLLTRALDSSSVVARGFKAPYAGFPMRSTLAQSLRPFPQFTTINYWWAPLGRTWYDALQVKVIKRFSHGLDVNSGFTWQKELMMGSEGFGVGAAAVGTAAVNDVFDRKTNKYISSMSRPYTFYMAANYTTPRFERFGRALSWIMRDWTFGTVLQYASGMPIRVPSAQTRLSSYLFRGTFAERVPGEPLFMGDINCNSCFNPFSQFALNPKAWVDPPEGKFGTSAAFYNDYRQRRSPAEAMSFGRIFRIREKVNLTLRADFTNIFNRARWTVGSPLNAKLAPRISATTGETEAGFGDVNTRVGTSPRMGIIVARLSF